MADLFIDTTTVKAWSTGTGRYSRELATSLGRHNTVITPDQSWNPQHPTSPASSENYHVTLNFKLLANQNNVHADACFFPNYFMPPSWPYPSAVTIHDVSFLTHPWFYSRKMSNYYRMRIRHTVQNAKFILTVSEASKRSISDNLRVPADRIMVHPPSPPLAAGDGIRREKSPYLLYIGNLEPKKNIVRMLEAFVRLPNKNGHKLLLLGNLWGPRGWRRKVQHLIRDSAGIEYKGYVPDEQLSGYLTHASGLLLVSHVEGFGLPAMDALAHNIPVLISRDPALNEVCRGSGITVNECDSAEISGGMEQLVFSEKPMDSNTAMHQRYGQKRYDDKLDEIADRLASKTAWFFPTDISSSDTSPLKCNEVKTSILAAVCYAAVFRSGINVQKLYLALGSVSISFDDFLVKLTDMIDTPPGLLVNTNGVIRLNDETHYLPHEKNQISDNAAVRKKHRNILKLIIAIPWVKGLYYSGGTAHGAGLHDRDDLDLLIVTAGDRAWMTYTAVRLVSRLAGAGTSVCANYILDEHAHEIHWQRDYYTAFQLLFLKKVALKPDMPHIRYCNTWMHDYFPNGPEFKKKTVNTPGKTRGILRYVNLLIMMVWTARWKKNGFRSSDGGLLYDAHRIKLHTNDHRPNVSRSFSLLFGKTLTAFKAAALKQSSEPLKDAADK